MKKITLVIGGCKSGKSRHAVHLADASGLRKVFIATCEPFDAEMRERVARHKAERDAAWISIDIPILLPEALSDHDDAHTVLLVDCLTLWVNNLLMASEEMSTLEEAISKLEVALSGVRGSVILVSNEVGAGIVPENRLARKFRDVAGILNQRIAALSDEVIFMVAGIPLTVKGGNTQ